MIAGLEQPEDQAIHNSSDEEVSNTLLQTPAQYRRQIALREHINYLERHPYVQAAILTATIPLALINGVLSIGAEAITRYVSNRNRHVNSGYTDSERLNSRIPLLAGGGTLISALSAFYYYPTLMLAGYFTFLTSMSLDIAVNSPPIFPRLINNNRVIAYLFQNSGRPGLPVLRSLPEALAFINACADIEEATASGSGATAIETGLQTEHLMSLLQPEEQSDLYRFLCQLIDTDEFNHSQGTRRGGSRRIINILSSALNNPEFREEALSLIHDSIADCNDHALLTLSNLEAQVFVSHVENTISQMDNGIATEQYLHESARRMFFFDEISRYSRVFHNRQPYSSEGGYVEVENAFHVLLRGSSGYPLPTTIRRVHSASKQTMPLITAQDIEDLKIYLDNAFCEEFEDYLQSWKPWQMYQRRLLVTSYDDLPVTAAVEINGVCPISQSEPENPVQLNGVVYEYRDLRKWYVLKGTDPITRHKMNWNDVNKPE